ncbi:hematopoietic SH2 domain-containing protein homolog isoform X1 [Fundulus heteroclitus]|uniref:hematopoietic SH2 domain-containing protein homolog isoform X1 n=2 Tax=Fundulus heteroclitus TaxID=8078 RepID=UPI00165C6672|nr:hematopoietic SH2 domain-containing protein homolog isoform X1 [Fundulus heteroclitus]
MYKYLPYTESASCFKSHLPAHQSRATWCVCFVRMMEWSQSTPGQRDPFTWFTESQLQSVLRNGSVPEWFHGIITRKTAEELLMVKPPGYFLVRVSESRVGYTLSYRAEEHCRHFMIEVLEDGQYIIVGENKTYRTLHDLVDFHRINPIMPFNQVLTLACGQSSDHCADYAELLIAPRPRSYTTSVLPNNLRPPTLNQPEPEGDVPPALPHRPNNLRNSAIIFPNSTPNKLYPCLEKDVQRVTAVPPALPAPNTRKDFTANSSPWTQPPEVPLRNPVAQKKSTACARMTSGPDCSPAPSATERKLCNSLQTIKFQELNLSVVTNLKSLKKKFQKKTSSPQENVYSEITVPAHSGVVQENEYQEITEELTFGGSPHYRADVRLNDQRLPQEYLSPPPFAPGY